MSLPCPSGTGCSNVNAQQDHSKPVSKPAPVQTPLSTGPPGPCSSTNSSFHGAMGLARSLFQCGLPTWSQLPLSIHLVLGGSFLHAAGGSLHTHGPPHMAFLSHFLTLLFRLLLLQQFFSHFLNTYHRGTITVIDGLSLGQWQVYLGASWHWLHGTWRKLPVTSQRRHPVAYFPHPSATKTCHINPLHIPHL